jgi:2-polyprenyl-6-methoxyphenol hydroxylase-like FAD-dependent oxidoreductase
MQGKAALGAHGDARSSGEGRRTASCYDVAIVGYGPTGMMLAALLGQLGHRVVVLERYQGLYNLPRAACFDDEIMRTFQKLGLVDDISRGAVVQRDYDWINAAGETLVEFEYSNPGPCGWAALYMMFQPHVEDVLDRCAKALTTVEVRQGFNVSQLEQDDAAITLRGLNSDGEMLSLRARFAIGADGGNGFMRRALCTEVDDYGFQENWLVCDFRMLRSVTGLPNFRQVCDPAQPTSIVKIGPNHHRFSFMLDANETPDEATKSERVWLRVERYLTKHDAELIRAANYVFRSRIAGQWQHGRAFLAGDAAHEMPPFLAQGMCSGIRDAHNLAWKLDGVLTGRADETLLSTYQPEREPHVRFITEKAIELGRVQTIRDPAKALERDERLLTRRRAHQTPDKLRFPALTGGLIESNGELFLQGHVRSGNREGLFDDIVGCGWCIVTYGPGVLNGLTELQRAAWTALGGRVAAVAAAGSAGHLEDIDGVYASWFAAHSCAAVVVRPDWYVYGTASDGSSLTAMLARLAHLLRGMPVPAARPELPRTQNQVREMARSTTE